MVWCLLFYLFSVGVSLVVLSVGVFVQENVKVARVLRIMLVSLVPILNLLAMVGVFLILRKIIQCRMKD